MAKRSTQQKKSASEGAERIVSRNKRATYDYAIDERIEAGLVLMGSEVKSLRDGKGSIAEAYARIEGGEMWLEGAHIPIYLAASFHNHEPTRRRKLLLKAEEIERLDKRVREKGYTIVPMALYFRDGWAKCEIGLGKGQKHYDKREGIKSRDADREAARFR